MSDNQNRGLRDFSKYDSMTTEELEEILRLDADAPMGEESDEELLFYVMGVLADRRNNTEFTGKTALEAYESFKQHYLPEEEHIESVPAAKRKPIYWLRSLTAAAAAVVIIISLSLSANAFGWDFWNVVAKWAQETFSFVGDGTEVSEPRVDDDVQYASLQDALERNYMDANVVPTWFPEGYVLDSVSIDANPMQEIFFAFYLNGEKKIKITIRSYLNEEPEQIERSDDFLEVYSVSGTDYHIFYNHNQSRAAWIVDSYECYISGELTIEEIKEMIDSIGKG